MGGMEEGREDRHVYVARVVCLLDFNEDWSRFNPTKYGKESGARCDYGR